jgi:ABC-type polysaccharide/polyol phosphate export permease
MFNPIAAVVLALRTILMEGQPPLMSTLQNLSVVAALTLTIGWLTFGRLKNRFYDYL